MGSRTKDPSHISTRTENHNSFILSPPLKATHSSKEELKVNLGWLSSAFHAYIVDSTDFTGKAHHGAFAPKSATARVPPRWNYTRHSGDVSLAFPTAYCNTPGNFWCFVPPFYHKLSCGLMAKKRGGRDDACKDDVIIYRVNKPANTPFYVQYTALLAIESPQKMSYMYKHEANSVSSYASTLHGLHCESGWPNMQ